MAKIAVLVSGSGSNLQAIIDSINNFDLECTLEFVIADRECYGLERAKKAGINSILLDRKIYKNNLSKKIDDILYGKVDFIILAGFLSILDNRLVEKWNKKIINIHPSLLPKYGGSGMYGIKIHKAVIEKNEKISGCTVHYVDSGIDTGEIIKQEIVEIEKNETPLSLQKKILEKEHVILTEAIKKILI